MLAADERSSGMAVMLAMTPLRASAWRWGRLLAGAGIATAGGFLATIACLLLRIIALPLPHPWLLLGVLGGTACAGASAGLVDGQLPLAPRTTAVLAMLLTSCAMLLGGAFCIPAFLPEPLPLLCSADPFHYAVDAVRQALFYATAASPWPALAVLLGVAILGVLAGSRWPRISHGNAGSRPDKP